MINNYERIQTKVKAIQFLDDSETREDVKELLGDKFLGFQTDSAGKLFVYWDFAKGKAFAPVGYFIYKDNSGFLWSMSEKEFNSTYKKVWD